MSSLKKNTKQGLASGVQGLGGKNNVTLSVSKSYDNINGGVLNSGAGAGGSDVDEQAMMVGEAVFSEQEEKDFLKYSTVIGVQLGQYIAMWNVPDEMKDAMLAFVHTMTPKQQVELLELFEEATIAQTTKLVNSFYQKRIGKILENTEKVKQQILDDTTKKMNRIADEMEADLLKTTMTQ